MQFMLLIYTEGEAGESWERLSEAEQQAILAEYGAIYQAPGIVAGAQLQPTATSHHRARAGRPPR